MIIITCSTLFSLSLLPSGGNCLLCILISNTFSLYWLTWSSLSYGVSVCTNPNFICQIRKCLGQEMVEPWKYFFFGSCCFLALLFSGDAVQASHLIRELNDIEISFIQTSMTLLDKNIKVLGVNWTVQTPIKICHAHSACYLTVFFAFQLAGWWRNWNCFLCWLYQLSWCTLCGFYGDIFEKFCNS